MQRIIERTKHAERHAARALQRTKERKAVSDTWTRKQNALRMLRRDSQHIVQARQRRREDFETGSLAPRRDVGDKADTYATMTIFDLALPEVRPERRKEWIPFRVGDRVVVLSGRDRGRISEVSRIDEERRSVEVQDVNVTAFSLPAWFPREEGDTRKVVETPAPFPIEDVRLVYPLPDPKTGIPKDVVIEKLLPVYMGKGETERCIPGTKTLIPWPDEAEEEHEETSNDTERSALEEVTFQPYLLHPPMPTSVIDELRNKRSRFRTRHEWEFVQEKTREDEEAERRKELPKTMRTPLKELAELRARQKAAEGEKGLSVEQLAKIGEVIAQERARAKETIRALDR